jgi:hypothetical protein
MIAVRHIITARVAMENDFRSNVLPLIRWDYAPAVRSAWNLWFAYVALGVDRDA